MRQHKRNTDENAFSILTLDDDPIMTSTIQAYFQRSGYRVDVENDPYRAVERIRQGSYDILLLDFLMSPICGDQVVEQVRQFNKELFIILLTGHKSMAPPIKTIRALDIQGYFEKSDRFDQLEVLVESCVKSIRQMRTIRSYKDGLSVIVDGLPQLYSLSSTDHVCHNILQTASALLPCQNVIVALRTAGPARITSRALGEDFSTPTADEACQMLVDLEGKTYLIRDRQVILPLANGGQEALGLLLVTLKEPPKYDQLQLLELFARQASVALSNCALHALIQDQNQQLNTAYDHLQDSYLEMISIIRRIVDAKDPDTRGHSDRVAYYAEHLCRSLGKDEETCERLHLAGLFHDVGKLSIPDEILLKPERLTEEEYRIVRSHPRSGAELLSAITRFRPILPAVRSHHERPDGLGYPDGLRGDAIPEEARIIAVADTFDAMTSDRSYRKALSLQEAIAELERYRGSQLDSNMVNAFLAMIRSPGFFERMKQDMAEEAPYGSRVN